MFRTWAEDWVLTSNSDALFELPLKKIVEASERVTQVISVSVSPTLGIVGVHWFTHCGRDVCGCVGDGKVLVKEFCSGSNRGCVGDKFMSWYEYSVLDLREWPLSCKQCFFRTPVMNVKCNREWIVGFPRDETLWVVKVVNGDPVEPEQFFSNGEITAGSLQFSPFSDDTVIVLTTTKTGICCFHFVDLEASFREQETVVTSTIKCGETWPQGVMWMPDGATYALYKTISKSSSLIDCATFKQQHHFPEFPQVTPISKNHAYLSQLPHQKQLFQVYNTIDKLAAASLSVPCTWSLPSAHAQSGLIISTTHNFWHSSKATEIIFKLHDGPTGSHIADISVPVHPKYYFDPTASFYY
ncbi:hypothetical protein Pelo_2952 [Pelomyxa schiedti]|nr:hypothetical protein Pelo_2952 [Pelomyxa schiedti]